MFLINKEIIFTDDIDECSNNDSEGISINQLGVVILGDLLYPVECKRDVVFELMDTYKRVLVDRKEIKKSELLEYLIEYTG